MSTATTPNSSPKIRPQKPREKGSDSNIHTELLHTSGYKDEFKDEKTPQPSTKEAILAPVNAMAINMKNKYPKRFNNLENFKANPISTNWEKMRLRKDEPEQQQELKVIFEAPPKDAETSDTYLETLTDKIEILALCSLKSWLFEKTPDSFKNDPANVAERTRNDHYGDIVIAFNPQVLEWAKKHIGKIKIYLEKKYQGKLEEDGIEKLDDIKKLVVSYIMIILPGIQADILLSKPDKRDKQEKYLEIIRPKGQRFKNSRKLKIGADTEITGSGSTIKGLPITSAAPKDFSLLKSLRKSISKPNPPSAPSNKKPPTRRHSDSAKHANGKNDIFHQAPLANDMPALTLEPSQTVSNTMK